MQKKSSKRITVLPLALCLIIPSYCFYRSTSKATQPRQQEVRIQGGNEKKIYLSLTNYSNASILVPIRQQKMTTYSGNQVTSKATVPTGVKDSPTPTGKPATETERGDFSYSKESSEGAYYRMSFKDHRTYLFHSVPTDCNRDEIKEEAEKLGTSCLHGYVKMSKEDAKWFYENISEGAIISIH